MELDNADTVAAVRLALENPNYKWRTAAGIAKETELSKELVDDALNRLADQNQLVKLPMPSPDRGDLFTTRRHFRETASFSEKLLGVFKNRVT